MMPRNKAISTISIADLYREILAIKKEAKNQKTLISSLLTRMMEIELKQGEPKQDILSLKTELMKLAANLDERFDKQSLLAAPERGSCRFRETAEKVILRSKVTNALRATVNERKRRDEELNEEEFQQTMTDLGHMLKILEDIGENLNVPGLPAEFATKLHHSLQVISSVLEKK